MQSAAHPCVTRSGRNTEGAGAARENPSDSDPFSLSGRQDSNLRPLGPEARTDSSTQSIGVQAVAFAQPPEGSADASTSFGRSGTLGRVTQVLPKPVRDRSRRVVGLPFRKPETALLTVREVAARLCLSTATVYALWERGELAHLRVSNAIRVRSGYLEQLER